jgi:hypothetical protein
VYKRKKAGTTFPVSLACRPDQLAGEKPARNTRVSAFLPLTLFFGGFMFVTILDKQRRAVSVVKTALQGAGISGRSVCVTVDKWPYDNGADGLKAAVFVSSPDGTEPHFATGNTIVEAVRNMIDSIKGRANGATSGNQPEAAPF